MSGNKADSDVIVAIATASGRGGVGIVRVSGPTLESFIQSLLGRSLSPRQAILCSFPDADGKLIDQGLALYFRAPSSYTGEDVLELHGHGSPAGLNVLLQRCLQLGARVAQPGEFTQRAFLSNKLDLAQAEAVADLIEASSIAAVHSAMRSLSGEFSRLINQLIDGLIEVRAQIEAILDFPEEALDFLHSLQIMSRLDELQTKLQHIEQAAQQGSLLREGIQVVLIGQPNVGKSSLLNRLAGQELAIVTEYAGTTRDAIRETIIIAGVPMHVIDTAGLRETEDPIERIGIARTWQAIEHATAALLLVDVQHGLTDKEQTIIDRLPPGLPRLVVHNKSDLLPQFPQQRTENHFISAKTGDGVDSLIERLLDIAGWQGENGGVFLARARHLLALRHARSHIGAALTQVSALELLAEELRLAQAALTEITGQYSADELLGEVFSRFCIGK